jgi:hypothetical protein
MSTATLEAPPLLRGYSTEPHDYAKSNAIYRAQDRTRRTFTEAELADFIARKSSPKWKAPKVRKSALLPELKPERRQRLQEEWHYLARVAWGQRGVSIGEYVREEYEMQTEEEAGQ